jgi:hypothetical protein
MHEVLTQFKSSLLKLSIDSHLTTVQSKKSKDEVAFCHPTSVPDGVRCLSKSHENRECKNQRPFRAFLETKLFQFCKFTRFKCTSSGKTIVNLTYGLKPVSRYETLLNGKCDLKRAITKLKVSSKSMSFRVIDEISVEHHWLAQRENCPKLPPTLQH